MKNKALLSVLIVLFAASCSESEIVLDKSDDVYLQSVANSTSAMTLNYHIDYSTLLKFLSLREKTATTIIPLIEKNDTIAYYVQYVSGWEILSADKRMAPVIIRDDSGVINSPNDDGQIQNLLASIAKMRENLPTKINGIWQLWEAKSTNKRRVARGIGQGMWIPLDTVYYERTIGIDKIVDTNWGQKQPWNTFTKIINSKNAPVGCGPVAAGQVIYHFRKGNHRDCEVPTSAKYTNGYAAPEYSEFSSSCWPLMAKEIAYVDYPNYTALFLGYLGKQMDAKYGSEGTSVIPIKIGMALQDYKLTYDIADKYDFHSIYSDLKCHQPVILCAETKDKSDAHAFIVNGYITETFGIRVSYIWDPEHRITEWEFENYDESMFMQDASGNEFKEEETILSENVYFRMNWGYSGYEDNRLYNVAYSTSVPIETGGRPDYIFEETVYSPYWICGKKENDDKTEEDIIYNRIYKAFYNIRESNY